VKEYGFSSSLVTGKKALQGDDGDNITGVAGIGDKRSLTIMQQYPDIHDLLNNLPLENKRNLAYINSINESKEIIERNLTLVDLRTYCKEALGASNASLIDQKMANLLETENA